MPDILNILQILNLQIHSLAQKVLVKKLASEPYHLRLYFDQENHWRFTIDFKLTKTISNRLAFAPIVKHIKARMYTSMLLCKPSLCRISLIGPDILMHKKYVNDNLMRSSVSLNVKELEMIEQYVPKQHLCFVYKVTKVPKHQIKTRPGERWVEPLELECSVDFLSKPKCIIQRVFDHLHCKSVNRHDQKHLSSTRIPAQDQRNGVAEIGGLWKQKYHYLSPVQDKSPQIPMLGAGLSL